MAETFSGASRYDVFINFRGEDTRHGFTGHLYDALRRKGIRAFMDENDIQRGEEIRTTLEEAIKGSRIAITVLSKDYASSSFCLNELETILGCYRENNTLLFVIPVFYKVDPSDVRHQRGSYAEGLASLEERFHPNMEKWRTALQEGTGEVKIIRLDFPIYDKQEKIEWDGNALKEMKNLKALIIRNGILSQAPNYLPESLRIFEWHTSFASLAYATSNSSIPPLGCGGISKARFWIPDASGLSNLKEFSFEYCENLIIVHESIDSIFQQTNLHSGIIILNFFLLMAKTCSDASIYDVFINFRGEDTRYEFMTHLHRAFRDKGIRAFMDEEDLKGGDKITTKLKGGDYKC
ncbi:Toll/interleukin-1 receptor-like protein [Glycine soja]